MDTDLILEAGCGEGYILQYLHELYPEAGMKGFDISDETIKEADFDDNTFGLAVASEVLEHMENPEKALAELIRVSSKYIFISVPLEPLWRLMNMMRGKYLSEFKNTPGHIQHWNKKSKRMLLNKFADQITIENIVTPLPWMMMLLKKKGIPDEGKSVKRQKNNRNTYIIL